MWQNFLKSRNSLLTDVLLVFLASIATVWFLQFLWKRRKIYQESINLPGPFALPLLGSSLTFVKNRHDLFGLISGMYEKYPSIFRLWLGPNLFYGISDPKYFEILLTSPNALRKESLYRMTEPVTGHGLFSQPDVARWKKHRKTVAPAFNQKILDSFVEVFVEKSEILAEVLEGYVGKGEPDLLKVVSRCTLDIICLTAMGIEMDVQRTDSSFPKWLDRSMEIIMKRIFNIFYHNDFIFRYSPLGREFYYNVDMLRSYTKKVLRQKKKDFSEKIAKTNEISDHTDGTLKRAALLDLMIEMNHNNQSQFTDEELMDETITFMIAGSDTTASSSCFALTMLAMHQDIQEKVLAEVLEVAGPTGNVQLSHLPKLKFLERAIKETLRLFPVGSFIVRKVDQDIDLGDHVVRKGCSISFGIRRVHTNEKFWPEPFKFDPDRFLPEEVAKRTPGYFIPFSYGPRNCMGYRYAIMAMKCIIATVVRKFHLTTTYKDVEEIKLKLHMVIRPVNGYQISFHLRKL